MSHDPHPNDYRPPDHRPPEHHLHEEHPHEEHPHEEHPHGAGLNAGCPPGDAAGSRPAPRAPAGWAEDDQRLFRRVLAHLGPAGLAMPAPASPFVHLGPLQQMLLAARAVQDDAHGQLACCVAAACMGQHHLWQDLGLSGRPEVSRLMALAFPGIHASNTRQLRWKRHLFLLLGEQLGVADLLPPRCSACEDAPGCLGSPVAAGGPGAPQPIGSRAPITPAMPTLPIEPS